MHVANGWQPGRRPSPLPGCPPAVQIASPRDQRKPSTPRHRQVRHAAASSWPRRSRRWKRGSSNGRLSARWPTSLRKGRRLFRRGVTAASLSIASGRPSALRFSCFTVCGSFEPAEVSYNCPVSHPFSKESNDDAILYRRTRCGWINFYLGSRRAGCLGRCSQGPVQECKCPDCNGQSCTSLIANASNAAAESRRQAPGASTLALRKPITSA